MTVRFLLVFACLALTACGGVRHNHRHTVSETVVINLPPNAIRVYGGYYMLPLPQPVQGCPAYRAHSTTGTAVQTIYFRSFDGRFVLIRPVNCTTIAIAPPPGHIPPGLIGNPGRGLGVGGNPPGHGGGVIRPPTPRGGPGVPANAGGGQGLAIGSNAAGGAPPILPGNNGQPRNGNAGGEQGFAIGSNSAGGAPPILPGNNAQPRNGNAGGGQGFATGSNSAAGASPILPGNNTRPRNGNAGGGQGPATGSTSAGGASPILPGNNGQRGNGNSGVAPACPDAAGAGRGSPSRCR